MIEADGARRLTTMAWGLPADAFSAPVPAKQRGTLYSRDFWRTGSRLDDLASLSRCLILLEAFANPVGQAGQCTRSWVGLSDHPLVAWAALCADDACAGVLIAANERIETLGRTMPRLLKPEDEAAWLAGSNLLSLGPPFVEDDFYCENLAERWSTGLAEADALPLFATHA